MSYIDENTIDKMMGKRLLFIKVETTGLPVSKKNQKPENTYGDPKISKNFDNSRIVQIAWASTVLDENFKAEDIDVRECVRKADIDISAESEKIHGLTTDDLKKGLRLKKLLDGDLGKHIMECDYVLAYNAFFDISILRNEIYRLKYADHGKKMFQIAKHNKIICVGQLAKYIMKDWKPIYDYQIPPQVTAFEECMGEKPEYMAKHMAGSSLTNTLAIFQEVLQEFI